MLTILPSIPPSCANGVLVFRGTVQHANLINDGTLDEGVLPQERDLA